MNLEDLVDPEYGLQQDDWSLSHPHFGEGGRLEVVGWGRKHSNGAKVYVLRCSACSQDCELFGDGYFGSTKGGLVRSSVPCGCAKSPRWSKEQFSVLCSRKADELGFTFLGFVGEWKGQKTKIRMLCEEHGDWSSGIISSLVNDGRGCPGCKADASMKSDEAMVASFFASSSFHSSTKFYRSDRINGQGRKIYWFMSCPDCGETGESMSYNLQRGQRACGCSVHRQKEAYINWVVDEHGTVVAIKFGISRDSNRRIKQQNSKSAYTIKQHSVYQFPDVASCKKAERECKQELECGVVLKRDMHAGWTETTWVYSLEKIEEIYKRNGGNKTDMA